MVTNICAEHEALGMCPRVKLQLDAFLCCIVHIIMMLVQTACFTGPSQPHSCHVGVATVITYKYKRPFPAVADSSSQEFQSAIPHGGPLAPAPPPDAQSHPQPQLQSPAQGQPAPRRQFVAEPEAEEQVEEQAAAAHVLLCCDDSLRLYPAEGIRVGDRSANTPAASVKITFSVLITT